MKAKIASLFTFLILVLMMLACSTSATPDTQATVEAAVQATRNAEKNAAATVDAAVEATVTQVAGGNQSAIATAVQATLTAQPTPDYANLSEEELSAMIDTAVATAVADSEAASASTSSATSDGTVTDEEAAATSTTVYQTYYDVAYAQELIDAYDEYYGEYADAALESLNAMEDDLASISQSLEEIDATMTQGAETASAAIDKLNAAAANIQTKATEAQTKAKGLSEQVKTSLDQREADALKLKPTQIESDKIGALTQTHDFLDAFKGALADGKFSPTELTQISQLGANARASLLKTGDPQLAKLSSGIEGLTRNAARGELGSARRGVGDFEKSVPERPGRKK